MASVDIQVTDFEWDWDEDGNVDHIARHEVHPEDVNEVKDKAPRFGLNAAGRTHIMIGANRAGRYLHVAMVATPRSGCWFVVTANWLSRRRGQRLYDEMA
jgi:hypothetical protein